MPRFTISAPHTQGAAARYCYAPRRRPTQAPHPGAARNPRPATAPPARGTAPPTARARLEAVAQHHSHPHGRCGGGVPPRAARCRFHLRSARRPKAHCSIAPQRTAPTATAPARAARCSPRAHTPPRSLARRRRRSQSRRPSTQRGASLGYRLARPSSGQSKRAHRSRASWTPGAGWRSSPRWAARQNGSCMLEGDRISD
jgi:hypothetical protein